MEFHGAVDKITSDKNGIKITVNLIEYGGQVIAELQGLRGLVATFKAEPFQGRLPGLDEEHVVEDEEGERATLRRVH